MPVSVQAPAPCIARHRCPERPGRRRVLYDTDGLVWEGQRGFSRTGKTPGISFLVEIFGEIPPRPGQVGNTWEMHYGTNTGSCGVHLVLLRPSQHSGARPGVVPHHGQILVQSFRLESMSISQPPFSYTLGDRHSEQNLAGALRGAYIRLGTYSNLYLNTVCLDSFWQIPCVLCGHHTSLRHARNSRSKLTFETSRRRNTVTVANYFVVS